MQKIAIALGIVGLTIAAAVAFQLLRPQNSEALAARAPQLSPPVEKPEAKLDTENKVKPPLPATPTHNSPAQVDRVPKSTTETTPLASLEQTPRQRVDRAMQAHRDNTEQLRALADVQGYLPENPDMPIYINTVLQKWAADDPTKMMEWYRNNYQEARVSYSPQEFFIAETLALKDVDAAMEYAQFLEDQFPSAQPQVTIAIARGVVNGGNYDKALAWLGALEPDTGQSEATRVVVSNWAKKQPKKALQWASELQDKELRDKAVTAVAARIMKDDPEQAMNQVVSVGISENAMVQFETQYRKALAQRAFKDEKRKLKEAYRDR